LGKAYEEVGFVAVKNHGVPDELIGRIYDFVQQFFSLPLEQKSKYEIPGLAGQRGYTSFGREHAKGSDAPDLKEFFQYGQQVEDGDAIRSEYPDNVKVYEVPGFNDTLFQAYRNFEKSELLCFRPLPFTLVSRNIILMTMYTMVIVFCGAFIIHLLLWNQKVLFAPSSTKILT